MMNIFVRRIVAFLIDVTVVGALLSPVAFLVSYFNLETSIGRFFAAVGGMLFVFKDFYSTDGSIGKKYTGLKLSFDATLNANDVSYYKLVRNVPLFLWPIEGLVAIVNRGKRLGDVIGKSRVGPTAEAP